MGKAPRTYSAVISQKTRAKSGNGRRLSGVATRTIDVCLAYRDLDDFWEAQTPGYAPTTKIIAGLGGAERAQLRRAVGEELHAEPGAVVEYCARANAIKARVPRCA